jgi:hypothetical protein
VWPAALAHRAARLIASDEPIDRDVPRGGEQDLMTSFDRSLIPGAFVRPVLLAS